MIGRFPAISAAAPRETALEFVLEWGRGAGKAVQIGAPTVGKALDAYLARPNLRYEVHKNLLRQQFGMHLKDWLKLPLAATPSGANHLLKFVRTVWIHARRTHELPESPTMAIEWFEEQPNGEVIEDLKAWRRTIDALPNPIHQVFYEFILATGLRKTEAASREQQ